MGTTGVATADLLGSACPLIRHSGFHPTRDAFYKPLTQGFSLLEEYLSVAAPFGIKEVE